MFELTANRLQRVNQNLRCSFPHRSRSCDRFLGYCVITEYILAMVCVFMTIIVMLISNQTYNYFVINMDFWSMAF